MMTFMSILYFLPGRGSSLNGRLGLELRGRGYELRGRVLEGDFAKLSFPEQIDYVASDLVELDGQDTPVIANSWGAYWALHALLQNQKSYSRTLLISPILGSVRGEGRMFKPPLSKVMERSIDESLFPNFDLTVLVGSEDWQSPDDRCKALCEAVKGNLIVADGKDHDLGREVVTDLLDKWLKEANDD
jgi:pimeloyl-ACP methyl ester carboxylesterase